MTGERGGWHWALYVLGYLGAFLTAIYTFRMIFRAFHGEPVPEARELEAGPPAPRRAPDQPGQRRSRGHRRRLPRPHHAIAERALPMRVAMALLAVGAIGAGLLQIPKVDFVIDDFLAPTLRDLDALRTATPRTACSCSAWSSARCSGSPGIAIAYRDVGAAARAPPSALRARFARACTSCSSTSGTSTS